MAKVKYKPNFAFHRNPLPDDVKGKVGKRQGALIMKIARRSIRKRKKVSEPGTPPTNRVGLLKRFIFFSWEATEQRVIIGPEKVGKKGNVPHLLEYGGMATVDGKTARYQARPTMRLALGAAMAAVPELWKGALNKG